MINFEKNCWNYYEIDFYDMPKDEKRKLSDDLGMNQFSEIGCYYKDADKWYLRVSGMTFNITQTDYYPKLKDYLDKRFNKYLRKEKLKNINETTLYKY